MSNGVLTDLSTLDRYSKSGFVGWPEDRRTFFSPIDDVHGVLLTCLSACKRSLAIAMYGFDDEPLADQIKTLLEADHVAVQLTLDSSQAGGVHERALLARESYPNSVIAVGRSERGAIMHQKIAVIDGILTLDGSTNWSDGGETKQDNQLTVHLNPIIAAAYRARVDSIHASMLAKSA